MKHLNDVLSSLLVITGTFCAGAVLSSCGNGSAERPESQSQNQAAVNVFAASLTQYYIGVINSGPQWTEEVDDITKQNRAYLSDLVNAGKLVGVGQVTDSKDVRWVFFFKGESMEEAQGIVAQAPAVKAGRYTGRVRQAWGTKGMGSNLAAEGKAQAMASGPQATHYLAVFKKGEKWSAEEDESTRMLLQNHIANIVKLHQDGELKFYGAFDDQGEVRGFAVFQANSLKTAQVLLNDDPAVTADWINPEYYTFEVAEGVLP